MQKSTEQLISAGNIDTLWDAKVWKDGRAVEGTGLENRQWRNLFGGSNPSPSANTKAFGEVTEWLKVLAC